MKSFGYLVSGMCFLGAGYQFFNALMFGYLGHGGVASGYCFSGLIFTLLGAFIFYCTRDEVRERGKRGRGW